MQRLPQPANVHVDRALLDEYVIAPDLVEELRAAVDPVRMGHEEMEQTEFGGAQLDPRAPRRDAVRRRVEAQGADLDDLVAEEGRTAPYDRLDAREQLSGGERLGDVVVRAGLQSRHLV